MTDTLKEWPDGRRMVPVYVPVRDADGGVRLELVRWIEWAEFEAMIEAE